MDDDPHFIPPAEHAERQTKARVQQFTPEERAYLLALLEDRVLRQHKEQRATDRAAEAAAIIDDAMARRYGAATEVLTDEGGKRWIVRLHALVSDDEWIRFHALVLELLNLRHTLEAEFGDKVVRALFGALVKGQGGRPRGANNRFYNPHDEKDAERRRRQRKRDAQEALVEDFTRRKLPSDDSVK